MLFRQLFDKESSTYTYLLADEETRQAVLIDPVREQVERDIELLEELDLKLAYTLETHVHADHVTSSGLLRQRLGCKTVLSAAAGAGCPDVLVEDGEVLKVGSLEIEARHTPGHTDGDVSYYVPAASMIFTGDTIFVRGCGRTDFQQGDAERLYDSVQSKVFSLPDETVIYPGHDYKGRTMTTVAEEKKLNPRLGGGKTKQQFVEIMNNLKLAYPKKIDVAVPANLHCGLLHHETDRTWAPLTRTDDEVPEVSAEWVKDHASEVRLIDVRRPDELLGEMGAMAGAENVPLDTLEQAMADWKEKDERIVVFCRSGGRSGRAAKMLENAGFTHVASMHGGMGRWNELGLPVERPTASATA
ncbi:MAG TPA: MBL fold metallo-hydrolase [Sandaracinaceae bacterium LLY-WYZ-13_1]|nr:MBL fold metallo-hydrolase [Sandaracinaceae bacterium LLY-WYZ-13_1]